jgi:histidine triad (HIT) family protein
MEDTVFHKIIRGEIPAKREHEDDTCIVIHDISPKAPIHLLVIPKQFIEHIGVTSVNDAQMLGLLLVVSGETARKLKIGNAFKIVINNGSGSGQIVPYLHVHVLGGWKNKPHAEAV